MTVYLTMLKSTSLKVKGLLQIIILTKPAGAEQTNTPHEDA